MEKKPANELTKLDVEDEEQREERISALLEKLNSSSVHTTAHPHSNLLNTTPGTAYGAAEPPTELLARVRAFLPTIRASNEELAKQDPESIDIENVGEDEERYIEMNLGLGVFASRRRRSSSSSSGASTSSSEDESDSNSSESNSSSSSSPGGSESSSANSDTMQPISSRPIKPLPRRVAMQSPVMIEELHSHSDPGNDSGQELR